MALKSRAVRALEGAWYIRATMRRGLACVAFLLGVSMAHGARAAEPEETPQSEDDFFARGKALFAEGKYAEAYEAYKQAWARERSYDVAGNLGNVEVKLGRWADATEHLTYARDHLPPSLEAERKREVLARITELLSEVRAKVTEVDLVIQPKHAAIAVDGHARERIVPDKLWLEPGDHKLEVSADGHQPAVRTMRATAGGHQRVELALHPLGKKPATAVSDNGPSLALIVTGAVVGAAGIGVGIGLVVAAEGKGDDRRAVAEGLASNACGAGTTRTAECQQIEDLSAEENTLRNVGIASLVAGGTIGIATLVYALWPREEGEEAAFIIAPSITPGTATIVVKGSF